MAHEPPERCAIRKQNREVEQAELPPPRMRPGAWSFVQLDDRRVVAGRAENRLRAIAPHDAKSEDVLVVGERTRDVRNLQPNDADVCGGWQSKPRRRDSAIFGLRGAGGRANGFQ